ncbi:MULTISPECIES: hypothetical protein [unclassified Pseudomonas]|uniref:hypothetical protein n=1 Tax=unclassified Pseudomonas TaxID=196821 RepID=UPI00128D5ECE|nr:MULTISPECIES: hypothetical protein [unclassified Pseudomonas]MPQ65363.1 hypothetical protein [Pseudomonas sp. MWU12-2323]
MKAWILMWVTVMSPHLFAADAPGETRPLLYDKKHPPLMYGVGSHSCGMYLDASVNPGLAAPYEGFLSGYATARSVNIGADFFYNTDAAGIRHWLQSYCTAHPTAHFADAISGAVDEAITRYLQE